MTDDQKKKTNRRAYPVSHAFGRRVEMALTTIDMNQEELGLSLGINQSTISKWIMGRNIPNGRNMMKLAKALNTTPEALMGVGRKPTQHVRMVRIMGNVAAGDWREAIEQVDIEEVQGIGIPAKYDKVSLKAFRVKGDSMNLLYPDGSMVFVAPTKAIHGAPRNGQTVLVMRHDHGLTEATLKEFVMGSRGELWLWPRSKSPEHQVPIEYRKENTDVEITGVVIAVFLVVI